MSTGSDAISSESEALIPSTHERRSNTYVEAFARGLKVICAFNADTPEMTLSQVAVRTGLTRANARRVLLTLLELGYVAQDGRLFRLQAKVLDLGYAYLTSLSLPRLSEPILQDLVNRTGLSTNLAVLEGTDVVYIARVSSSHFINFGWNLKVGARLPAHLTAMGRVMLGELSEAQFSRYLAAAKWVKVTPLSVTDPEQLRKIVAADRKRQWSYVDRELGAMAYSLAVPIRGKDGRVVASVSMGGVAPTSRRDAEQSALPQLLEAAARISELAARTEFKGEAWKLRS